MVLTAGTLSLSSKTSTTANLAATAATGGVGANSYQWYRSQTSGFTPGGGNIISGATALTLADSGLVPGTQYYYKVVATDEDSPPETVEYTQLSVVTDAPVVNPNQFNQVPYLGMIDMRFPYNTVSVLIDASQSSALYAGAAVKMVDSAGGVPKVVGCTADTDEVLGFINYDIKTVSYTAGVPAEISMAGNVMYLYATAAIARGIQVALALSTNGGVQPATGATSDRIVGWAYDKATLPGELIRVFLKTPSFTVDA